MFPNNDDIDKENVAKVMEDHDLDAEEAEEVLEIAEELGVDTDDSAEIHEGL